MGNKSSSNQNKSRKRAPISNKVGGPVQLNDSILPTDIEEAGIKIESLDMTQDTLLGNKMIPQDLYEPSFSSRKSVS